MGKTWNGTLATQTVHFRGTSTVSVLNTTTNAPQFRTLTGAEYVLRVTGGVSGTFGAHVIGNIGGSTLVIAGVTGVAAAGRFSLWPQGYSHSGAALGLGAFYNLGDVHLINTVVPPATVAFQSGVGTAGISATLAMDAVLHGNF